MNFIKIVIGIIIKKNKIYITRGNYKKNLWEFPGGKINENETLVSGLKRELLEEVGILLLKYSFFRYVKYNSVQKKLKLYFFLIKKWKGKVYSRENYFYIWIPLFKLKPSLFPPANYSVITSLKKIKYF